MIIQPNISTKYFRIFPVSIPLSPPLSLPPQGCVVWCWLWCWRPSCPPWPPSSTAAAPSSPWTSGPVCDRRPLRASSCSWEGQGQQGPPAVPLRGSLCHVALSYTINLLCVGCPSKHSIGKEAWERFLIFLCLIDHSFCTKFTKVIQ